MNDRYDPIAARNVALRYVGAGVSPPAPQPIQRDPVSRW